MKKTLIIILAATFTLSIAMVPAYASDWDKAGKILTGIEGLRILSGGHIDLVGTIFGMGNKPTSYKKHKNKPYHNNHFSRRYDCYERVWVPHYRWEKKYIPRHEKYDHDYGKVIVEGHYIKIKVENGGHWERRSYCG